MAKAIISNGAPLSIAEHDALVSKIKSEAAQAHAEVLEAKGTIPNGMLRHIRVVHPYLFLPSSCL